MTDAPMARLHSRDDWLRNIDKRVANITRTAVRARRGPGQTGPLHRESNYICRLLYDCKR